MVYGDVQEAACGESSTSGDITPLLMNLQHLSILQGLTLPGPCWSHQLHPCPLSFSSPSLQLHQSLFLALQHAAFVLLLLLFSGPEIIFYYLSTARSSCFSGPISNDISSKRPALTTWFILATQLLAVTLLYFCTLCSYLKWTPLLLYLPIVRQTPIGMLVPREQELCLFIHCGISSI